MKMFTSRKRAVAAGLLTSLVVAAAAIAYWTTTGTGSGSATTGVSESFVVSQVGDVTGLVPGGDAQTIDINVNNPASFNQYLSGLTVSIKNEDGTAWSVKADEDKPACTKDDFTITQPVDPAGDLTSGDHPFEATVTLDNNSGNQDNCKDVVVPFVISAV